MVDHSQSKREWVTPKAVRYGSVEEITRDTKEKTFGGGDDVLIDNEALLENYG